MPALPPSPPNTASPSTTPSPPATKLALDLLPHEVSPPLSPPIVPATTKPESAIELALMVKTRHIYAEDPPYPLTWDYATTPRNLLR
jgi:hypothetical protein